MRDKASLKNNFSIWQSIEDTLELTIEYMVGWTYQESTEIAEIFSLLPLSLLFMENDGILRMPKLLFVIP